MPDPLPLELVTSGRDLTEPRLAPVGRAQVAFVQRRGPTSVITSVWLDGGDGERDLTFGPAPSPGRGLGGGCFTWVARDDELSIVYVARDGSLWWQRSARLQRLDGPHPDADPHAAPGALRSCRAPAVDASGRLVAYAVDEAQVWVVDLDAVADGVEPEASRQRLDDGRHEFCFDPAVSPNGATVSWQAWSPPDMPWDGASRVDVDVASGAVTELVLPDASIQQPRFTVTGVPVQVDDRSGWLNVSGLDGPMVAEPVEHAGPTWGMGNRSFAVGPGGRRVAVTRNEQGFGSLVLHDLQDGTSHRLGRGVHGHLDWVGDTIVALRSGARTPTQIVAYQVVRGADEPRRSVVAGSAAAAWPLAELPEPEPLDVRTGSAPLFARRYAAGQGRLLAWVHGGPTDQWRVDWRPRLHYWWSRGWDVLVVDPRGTTGHGRAHQQALHDGWGRLDVDDTAGLIRHAHEAGWATPATTVVMGGSSGGLTALGVLADHGDLVAGAVTSYPVSDLRALADVTHRFEAHYTDTLVAPNDGSVESAERFAALSPSSRAGQISSPLLVFHGTDDPVVPLEQSRRLVDRIRAVRGDGADVELVVYDGEGHGFRDPANVADEYARTEEFLQRVTRRPG